MYNVYMQRTQVYLTEFEKKGLKEIALRQGKSVAAILREAVDQFLNKNLAKSKNSLDGIFGSWKTNDSNFQEIRKSMDRSKVE